MPTDFGKRLAKAREHAGLTQAQLGEKVGMAQSTIAAAETEGAGSRKTPQLAAACKVNAHWLATGDGGDGAMLDGIGTTAAEPPPKYDTKPPVPPRDYHDRREVSESDWALLQDVKEGALEEDMKKIRAQAALVRAQVDRIVAERMNKAKGES